MLRRRGLRFDARKRATKVQRPKLARSTHCSRFAIPEQHLIDSHATYCASTPSRMVIPDTRFPYARSQKGTRKPPSCLLVCCLLQVLAQLKRCPSDDVVPGVAGLEAEMLCRLLKENPVLKRINGPCFPRLTGSIALKRYKPGEVGRRLRRRSPSVTRTICVCASQPFPQAHSEHDRNTL